MDNIIINREVEISSKIAGFGNDIPDLLVECQTGQSNIASVIIEVKGCWNPNLRESIKTQLYNRYMYNDTGYKYGIYAFDLNKLNHINIVNNTSSPSHS